MQPQLNQITRGQRALQSNLGDRSASSIGNLLQSQTNAYNAQNQVYGQKYNFNRQQDANDQQFNAQAKTQADQYNQQSQFQQLEDPRRRREGILDTQKRTDNNAFTENQMKERAYNTTRDYIQSAFNPYANYGDASLMLSNSALLQSPYATGQTITKTDAAGTQNDKTVTRYKRANGGKITLKPKMKKK